METGNPKQVAILCVMAVGAVGFLVTRLGGKASTAASAVAAERASAQKGTGVPSDLPILVDAFSHPKLAPQKPRAFTAVLRSTPPPNEGPPGEIDGPLPFVGALTHDGFIQPVVQKPAEKTTPKLEPKSEPVDVVLEATVGSSANVAFISIAGADSQPFRPNDQIKSKVRLLRIEDGAVVLSGPKGELTINVGERKRI